MVRVYEVEYEIDVKEKLLNKKEDIVKDAGRFWEHAVQNIRFKYELSDGDVQRARAVASILRLLVRRVNLVKKRQMVKEVD